MKFKLKMNDNSLFAILLRSSWWISAALAAALFAVFRLLLPDTFAPYAFFVALPIIVIASYAAWQQLRAPAASAVASTLERVRAMSWQEFSAALEASYRREGYVVERIAAGGADFALTKDGRVTLVGCKRWKVARTGIEPLRELAAAKAAREAHDCVYVATGEVTENARAFATQSGIRLLPEAELVRMFPGISLKS